MSNYPSWKELEKHPELISEMDDETVDMLLRKSRYEIELRESYSENSKKLEEAEETLRPLFQKIDSNTIKMEEEIYDLSKTFQKNQNYDVEVFSYGLFTNEGLKQLCTDLVNLTNALTSEFDKDDCLYIADLFSGGSNVAERRINKLLHYYNELLENTSKKVKSLSRKTLQHRSEPMPSTTYRSIRSLKNEIKSIKHESEKLGSISEQYKQLQQEYEKLQDQHDELEDFLNQNIDSPIVIRSPRGGSSREFDLSPSSPKDSDGDLNFNFTESDFTQEHVDKLYEIKGEIQEMKEENREIQRQVGEAQSEMEQAAKEIEDYDTRIKRISESMGPLKDKYYLMKNAYISLDSFEDMVKNYFEQKKKATNMTNEHEEFINKRVSDLKDKLNSLDDEIMNYTEKLIALETKLLN